VIFIETSNSLKFKTSLPTSEESLELHNEKQPVDAAHGSRNSLL
jgi:hypothetical protein